MFKIADATLAASFDALMRREDEGGHGSPTHEMSVSEAWTGDLSNGLLRLGERARVFHGLDASECGLLSMMRCYDAADRGSILKLFEQAATQPSRFCYSTTIIYNSHYRQPVFCIGESHGFEHCEGGTMNGVFIFPNFHFGGDTAVLGKPQIS